jgi:hypothetical protein
LARLRIPKEQVEALEEIINFAPAQFDTLLAALAAVPLSVDLVSFEDAVIPKIRSLSKNSQGLLRALVALNVTRAHSEPPISEFVNDTLDALREEGKLVKQEAISKATERITKLLSVDALTIATKGIHLLLDRERIFNHARILTDVRPIFGPQVTEAPAATLITHTLKISYYHDDGMTDFYLALDDDDISELEEVLRRARTKAETLTKTLASANIKVVRG